MVCKAGADAIAEGVESGGKGRYPKNESTGQILSIWNTLNRFEMTAIKVTMTKAFASKSNPSRSDKRSMKKFEQKTKWRPRNSELCTIDD
jgi:hypothetical protein